MDFLCAPPSACMIRVRSCVVPVYTVPAVGVETRDGTALVRVAHPRIGEIYEGTVSGCFNFDPAANWIQVYKRMEIPACAH